MTEVKIKPNLVGEAMDRACAELDGRTGETDSEMELDEANDAANQPEHEEDA